jgi:hypothetical protein
MQTANSNLPLSPRSLPYPPISNEEWLLLGDPDCVKHFTRLARLPCPSRNLTSSTSAYIFPVRKKGPIFAFDRVCTAVVPSRLKLPRLDC